MADKLVVEECRSPACYRIYWFLEDDQELGACVGEGRMWLNKKAPKNRDEWECWAIETALHKMGCESDFQGFRFDAVSEAKRALSVAKEATKQDRPLPDWAQEALKQGWKPPKGWKA